MAPKGTAQHDDIGGKPSTHSPIDSEPATAKRTGPPPGRPGRGQEATRQFSAAPGRPNNAFAGSMNFVWIHAALFAVWMLVLEKNPWPTLTLVVSLEAIFLSTFVMIGQNRQSAFQQAKADHDFHAQELELKTNTELTREIHVLTEELHRRFIRPTSERDESAAPG